MKQLLELKEQVGTIMCASDLFNKIKRMRIDFCQENTIVFYLDTKNKLIKSEVLFKGGLNECTIDPRIIFRNALKHNSNSIIVAHNHPSGDLTPSFEDEEITKKLARAGRTIRIRLIDAVTFNKKEY